jgi:hypothetical protein
MQTRTTVGFSLSLASVIIGAALHPYPHVKGWLPHRWEYVEKGSAIGVAWMSLANGTPPAETGGTTSLSSHISEPLDFIYRVPNPKTEAQAYLVLAGGGEVPLERSASFQRPGYYAVQPVRNYPPGTDHLDVVVRGKGLRPSRFRLRDLPPTRLLFPVTGPEVRQQTTDGLRFEGVSWLAAKGKHSLPYVVAAVRVVGKYPSGGSWEWRQVRFEPPFASPAEKSTANGSVSFTANRNPSFGLAQTQPWAPAIPRVRVTGRLAHFLTTEETLDFGVVEVIQNNRFANEDYRLRLHRPLVARGKSGLTVRLEPMEGEPISHSGFGPMLHLRAFVQDGTDVPSLPPAMRQAKGERVTEVWIGTKSMSSSLPNVHPVPAKGATTTVAWPGLKLGKRRLRMTVLRRVADREYAFDLRPNVQPRTIENSGLKLPRETTSPIGTSFDPTDRVFVRSAFSGKGGS